MSTTLLFIIILSVGCLQQFASDIYTPAVPAIGHAFASSLNLVQWSMAIYMFGVSISQIFYGILSEGIGRKRPLMFGLGIMLVGTLICVFATNIQMLIVGRLIQGLGAGAGAAMWRTIFRDVYTGTDLAKYGSYLAIGVTFIIPAAPAFGAYLQHYLGWRSIFVFLTLYTIATLLIVFFAYRETSQHHHFKRLKLSFIKKTFGELLSNRTFVGVTLAVLLSFGGLFAWMISAPVLLIHLSGMHTVAFGWFLFVGIGGAYASAGLLNGRLLARFSIHNMMRFGFFIMLLSGFFLLIGYFLWGINIWNIAPMMILFFFGGMLIFPNSNAMALTPFGAIAGYAAALYGTFQISGGAILGGVISHLYEPNQVPLAIVIIVTICIAWICFEVIVPRK